MRTPTALTNYLEKYTLDEITLTFEELETMVGEKLPPSAYKYKAWWANDKSHNQSKSWMNAGFKTQGTKSIHDSQKITFIRQGYDNYQKNCKIALKTNVNCEAIQIKDLNNKQCILLDEHTFNVTPFQIFEKNIANAFLKYDNHTVEELLEKKYYKKLSDGIDKNYSSFLKQNIQVFMKYLVEQNDEFYKLFLNKNGTDLFCSFKLCDASIFNEKGVYLYVHQDEIKYIGRCRDTFRNRFNVNYGSIQPINCYKEGQSTNTHMNSLMNEYGENIYIYLCVLDDIEEIIKLETDLIGALKPEWNKQGK